MINKKEKYVSSFIPSLEGGGAEKAILTLAKEYAKKV
jgi:hypothetical protein